MLDAARAFSAVSVVLEAIGRRSRRRLRRTSGSAAGRSRWRSARCRFARRGPRTDSSFRPRLRIVSIIPGIEIAAPERTESSSGSTGSPKRLPACSRAARGARRSRASSPPGSSPPAAMKARQASVVIVNPAGTGTPRARHLGEPGALAAEQRAPALAGLVEVVDELRVHWLLLTIPWRSSPRSFAVERTLLPGPSPAIGRNTPSACGFAAADFGRTGRTAGRSGRRPQLRIGSPPHQGRAFRR